MRIPPTRSDVLHPCDVVEDAAIAYGFNNLPQRVGVGLRFALAAGFLAGLWAGHLARVCAGSLALTQALGLGMKYSKSAELALLGWAVPQPLFVCVCVWPGRPVTKAIALIRQSTASKPTHRRRPPPAMPSRPGAVHHHRGPRAAAQPNDGAAAGRDGGGGLDRGAHMVRTWPRRLCATKLRDQLCESVPACHFATRAAAQSRSNPPKGCHPASSNLPQPAPFQSPIATPILNHPIAGPSASASKFSRQCGCRSPPAAAPCPWATPPPRSLRSAAPPCCPR